MTILWIVLDKLVFITIGFALCVGIICGGVIGIMSSTEVQSWLNDDVAGDILDTWNAINIVAKWIPGYRIGKVLGIKLAMILDDAVDL